MSILILHREQKKVKSALVSNNVYNERVPVIQVVPITAWSEKKNRITTNVEILPSNQNELSKKSIADCLQTRPIDHRFRLVKIRGELTSEEINKIDEALKIVFAL
jgi:mRNA interferase MazF